MSARVILVHGALHGAWCWSRVALGLRQLELDVTAVDLPGHGECRRPLAGLAEDARTVRHAIAAGDAPIVLCGHSYGGAVITEAVDAAHPVDHLVYLAAAVPRRGESFHTCLPEVQAMPIAGSIRSHASGGIVIDPEQAGEIFYHDCDEELASSAIERLGPHHSTSLIDEATHEPWTEIASTYVVCGDDRVIPPAAQERTAKRCRHRMSWPTSHSPMISRPQLLVSLLSEIAQAL